MMRDFMVYVTFFLHFVYIYNLNYGENCSNWSAKCLIKLVNFGAFAKIS